ncbi:hypothetical protein FVE85_8516 [Porphyridium purpureum]|uniref:Uncharacterized protein n=1 Tax=Porphyridium purpureum TaxID=35688 RepID=A0A5J4YI99_PORPP|nr:hypothetical protein FVE85_8516 [Porphyridium purpureum]|eukprot:POR6233..scf257_31
MARSVCAALPLNDKVEGSGIDARSSRKDESQDGTQNAGALTLREENTAATNEGHVVDPTIEVQGSNAQARRNWSHVMDTTLRTGYERLRPKWARIRAENEDMLEGISAKDLRLHAQAIGLLGDQATGLGIHRRGRKAADKRAHEGLREALSARATVLEQVYSSTEATARDERSRTQPCIFDVSVAKVVPFAEQIKTHAGYMAFANEVNKLPRRLASSRAKFEKSKPLLGMP